MPDVLRGEFCYLLGLFDGKKDEFLDKINDDTIILTEELQRFNSDKYNAIDGRALKQCDKLSAFIEAVLSISHGIKSKELVNGKFEIIKGLKTINGVDFKELASKIESEFGVSVMRQTSIEFD